MFVKLSDIDLETKRRYDIQCCPTRILCLEIDNPEFNDECTYLILEMDPTKYFPDYLNNLEAAYLLVEKLHEQFYCRCELVQNYEGLYKASIYPSNLPSDLQKIPATAVAQACARRYQQYLKEKQNG